MKLQLRNPLLALTALAGTLFLTGCASASRTATQNVPLNALSFSPVTVPNQTVKWSNDKYLDWNLRSIDTYYFLVPNTGYHPRAQASATPAPVYQAAAGAGPGAFQTGSGSFQLIPYRPGAWQ